MVKFKYINDLEPHDTHPCSQPGCRNSGEHRAPISPQEPNRYQWLCVDHIKEFNKKWDFFKGRTQEEIEHFQKEAVTGHRPTWRMHPGEHPTERLEAALNGFMNAKATESVRTMKPPIAPKDRQALKDLELSHPTDQQAIKQQYKMLVKRYHPDRNPGNKHAEEEFKKVTAAYRHLIDHYCTAIPKS